MSDNSKRPVTKKEVVAVTVALIFFGIPFFASTVLYKTFPEHPIMVTLFGTWWKRYLILIAGSFMGWRIAKLLARQR